MYSVLAGVTQENRPTTIQSGLKYRTICKRCNEFLGARYDPALIGLTKFVSHARASMLILPRHITVRTRPAAIFRSILGHLVAAKIDTHSGRFDEEVKSCILDETIPVPEKYRLYYWIYPYQQTVVIRDMVSLETSLKSQNQIVYFNLIKFFPLGFLVTDRSDLISPPKFGDFNNVSPSEFRDISIDLIMVQDVHFPEQPTNTRSTMFGRSGGVAAVARRKRERRLR
jgi:hypothetical protein